ncbi:hypothetical protein ACFL6C_03365 [Myxococcota bacterium]
MTTDHNPYAPPRDPIESKPTYSPALARFLIAVGAVMLVGAFGTFILMVFVPPVRGSVPEPVVLGFVLMLAAALLNGALGFRRIRSSIWLLGIGLLLAAASLGRLAVTAVSMASLNRRDIAPGWLENVTLWQSISLVGLVVATWQLARYDKRKASETRAL